MQDLQTERMEEEEAAGVFYIFPPLAFTQSEVWTHLEIERAEAVAKGSRQQVKVRGKIG